MSLRRIVLVEDSPTQAAETAFVLEDAGYAVEIAPDAEVAAVRIAADVPDLAVVDVILPGASGFDLCRQLRGREATRDLPVLLLTTLNRPLDIARGLACGADGYLNKPCDPAALTALIERTLADRTPPECPPSETLPITLDGQELVLSAPTWRTTRYLLSVLERLDHLMRAGSDARAVAAHALRRSEERLTLAAAGANDGLWDWDIETGEVYYSPRFLEILGYAPEEIAWQTEMYREHLHPDDRERFEQELEAHRDGTLARLESEHRIRCKDGSYRWVLLRGCSLRHPDGRAYRLAGSLTDIEERKQTEARLLAGSAELRAVLEAMPDLVLQLGSDGTILDCHAGRGFTVSVNPLRYVGRSVTTLLPPPVTGRWADALVRVRDTQTVTDLEFAIRTRTTTRLFEARLSPMPNGSVLAVVRNRWPRKRSRSAV
jgi:PAS domain S-box-containing protein